MNGRGKIELIRAEWPAPGHVGAVTTTRGGGISLAPYDGLNLAMRVGDDPGHVAANRRILRKRLGLDAEPHWLRQVHGTGVVDVSRVSGEPGSAPEADAWVCFEPGKVCGILTADCVPVFFCDRGGTRVGLAHAGWRGLSSGVLERTVAALDGAPSRLIAWLGPAISAHAYRVGDEVREAFVDSCEEDALAFLPDNAGTWHADLRALAAGRLRRLGVAFSGSRHCTFYDAGRFYSHRRDGLTGRIASLVWLRS